MPFGISIWGPILATTVAGAIASHNSGSSSSMPTESTAAQGIQGLVNQQIMTRLATNNGLPPGYQQQGIAGINAAFNGANTNENAALTARGLASTPVAASVTAQSNLARAGNISQFNASLPLVQQQLQAQNLQLAQGIINPQTGQTGSGTTTTGGGAAGSATNLAGYLGYLKGKGQNPFGNNSSTTVPDTQTGYVDSGGGLSFE